MYIRVSLGLKKKSNAEILIAAVYYTNCMTDNSVFAAADIVKQVEATVAARKDLEDVMLLPISETKADQVRTSRMMLDRNLNSLAAKVTIVANDPAIGDDQRITIVHLAGMEVRRARPRRKQVFSVRHGILPGTIDLTAKSGPVAHEWQYSKYMEDDGNRKVAPTTTTARTTISGLESFVRYAFYHRAVLAKGTDTDWEGPLQIVVH